MIRREDLIEIGRFAKPHGINGEIVATIDFEDLDVAELKCIFCDIDGIPVPFFIESQRPKGSSVLLRIEGIDNERQASMLSLKTISALRDEIDIVDEDEEEGWRAESLIGFTVTEHGETIGTITDIDMSTINYLFIVENHSTGATMRIPIADEFVINVDENTRTIDMDLPTGLLDL